MDLLLLQAIIRPIFGTFEIEEFKKFLRMGLVFTSILGVYWTIRLLKDVVLATLVGAHHIPYAKTASLFFIVLFLVVYNRLLNLYSREKVFYLIISFYTFVFVVVACLLLLFEYVPHSQGFGWWCSLAFGYSNYVLTESFGSIVVALFWAIASDTTYPESAKKGFYLVTALGQFGGIVLPALLTRLPGWFHFESTAVTFFAVIPFSFLVLWSMRLFFTKTPQALMQTFTGSCEVTVKQHDEAGFFEGLKLIVTRYYLLGIFILIMSFEAIVSVFDFNFKVLAAQTYGGPALGVYLANYGGVVNTIALLCLLLGISNITRVLGVSVALILVPIIMGGALIGFISLHSLTFLFWLMSGAKAVNYALNGPAIKQLYIPTSEAARFKAQSWIEGFGSRSGKGIGQIVNGSLAPLQRMFGVIAGKMRYMGISAIFGFSLVALWTVAAFLVGKRYNHAVKDKKLVC
ncbi:MAG: hypothetical protein UU47_C0019G0006 [candidate division TM6 bacterium GW2011_GWE2_41_16]|nr:MAG: hypothetical protein UU47_C0019G0006 [candidate division TM6 bacterium GW2011_GWE2_41_16]